MVHSGYDVVVVGGGPAGLNGALTLSRARRSVLVVDAGQPRNATAAHLHGFLSRDGMAPGDLLDAGRAEVRGYGGEVIEGRVLSAAKEPDGFAVTLADGRVVGARRLLVTCGVTDELPDVRGVSQRWGRDVLQCPYCHGWEVRDQAIGVLATGPMAVHHALLYRQWTEDVTLFAHTAPRVGEAEAKQLAASGIQVVEGEVASLEITDDRLTGVRLRDGRVVPRQAVVVASRMAARADLLAALGLQVSEHPSGMGEYVLADETGQTAVPGVWVAGNVTDVAAQIINAAAAGARAGAMINGDLVNEDVRRRAGS